uniref:Leucine-rich repeat-containing N-terminal plant-type domain-containing protein n=1 Tax=Fagus sylvatica TaxID=28930 RepID=A0A2N9GX01_FAGSY
MHAKNLGWLSSLSSLKYLDMGDLNLSRAGADWLHAVNMLPSLLELHLSWCELESLPPSLPFVNSTSLFVLDLSGNQFNSSIPQWLLNLTSLTKLDLSSNSFQVSIPYDFVNLRNLEHLDLSNNQFNSSIPQWLLNLTSLTKLDLSSNSFQGSIPYDFVNLRNLEHLDLRSNHSTGQLPSFCGNLCKLETLDLSENNFCGNIDGFFGNSSSYVNNSLESLDLSDNELVGNIPDSLGRLGSLRCLSLYNNSFSGSIPASIGNLSSLQELYLYDNKMNGTITENKQFLPTRHHHNHRKSRNQNHQISATKNRKSQQPKATVEIGRLHHRGSCFAAWWWLASVWTDLRREPRRGSLLGGGWPRCYRSEKRPRRGSLRNHQRRGSLRSRVTTKFETPWVSPIEITTESTERREKREHGVKREKKIS